MTWIRLLSLLGHLYKRKILGEIGSLVGRAAKLDLNTINRTKGRSARMVIYVNLDKLSCLKFESMVKFKNSFTSPFPRSALNMGDMGMPKRFVLWRLRIDFIGKREAHRRSV